jgi:hypothetical protein
LAPGNDYKIRVRDTSNTSLYDDSDPFTINTHKEIWVMAPYNSTMWRVCDCETITWSTVGNIQNVDIKLLKDGVSIRDIGLNIPNTGRFSWLVPSDLPADDTYQVRVSESGNSALYGLIGGDILHQHHRGALYKFAQ